MERRGTDAVEKREVLMTVTRAKLVDTVTEETHLKKREIALAARVLLEAIRDALAEGKNIELRGFGRFKVKNRRPRMARNPRTGDAVRIGNHRAPVFEPSVFLVEKINRLLRRGK
jgi:nucleoid DNA-binding protein